MNAHSFIIYFSHMAGIYLHIPFCKQACHYCNFHFSTSLTLKNNFIASILKEIELVTNGPVEAKNNQERISYLGEEIIETIYFGGGTPSLLSMDDLQQILDTLHSHFNIAEDAEITLEANPDDISIFKLKGWKKSGINRLSVGVQSFFEEDLQWMNRAHNASQALSSIQAAIQEGFNNMTIDLIYGTPALTDEKWEHNIKQALQLGIPHLSCYALTVEPSTALESRIKQKKSADVDPEKQANQFLLLSGWLKDAGYEHYEISNFAKPGMRSRHNSSYWQGKNYLGLGPSAHSFNGHSRQWNIANNALYIKALQNNILPIEIEHLTLVQQFNEYVMTSLRTVEGLSLDYMRAKFGNKEAFQLETLMKPFVENGKVRLESNIFQLTREGMLHADGIAASLFK